MCFTCNKEIKFGTEECEMFFWIKAETKKNTFNANNQK